MQKLTSQEIEKVFAIYYSKTYKYTNTFGSFKENTNFGVHTSSHIGQGAKLILSPISDITDEHAIEVAKIISEQKDRKFTVAREKNRVDVWFGMECIYIYFDGSIKYDNINGWDSFSVFQYLTLKGYAVPLFFGFEHWANGKTAFDLNLAIQRKV